SGYMRGKSGKRRSDLNPLLRRASAAATAVAKALGWVAGFREHPPRRPQAATPPMEGIPRAVVDRARKPRDAHARLCVSFLSFDPCQTPSHLESWMFT